jgi:hypothetical protein
MPIGQNVNLAVRAGGGVKWFPLGCPRSFFVVQINDIGVDQKNQPVFVNLPVPIPAYAGKQDKNNCHYNVKQVWTDFYHNRILFVAAGNSLSEIIIY